MASAASSDTLRRPTFNRFEVLKSEHSRLLRGKLRLLEKVAAQLDSLKTVHSAIDAFDTRLSEHRRKFDVTLDAFVGSTRVDASKHLSAIHALASEWKALVESVRLDGATDVLRSAETEAQTQESAEKSERRDECEDSREQTYYSRMDMSSLQREVSALRSSKLALVCSTSAELSSLAAAIRRKVHSVTEALDALLCDFHATHARDVDSDTTGAGFGHSLWRLLPAAFRSSALTARVSAARLSATSRLSETECIEDTDSGVRSDFPFEWTPESLSILDTVRKKSEEEIFEGGSAALTVAKNVLICGTNYSGKSCLRNHLALRIARHLDHSLERASKTHSATALPFTATTLSMPVEARVCGFLGVKVPKASAKRTVKSATHVARCIVRYSVIGAMDSLLKAHRCFEGFPNSLLAADEVELKCVRQALSQWKLASMQFYAETHLSQSVFDALDTLFWKSATIRSALLSRFDGLFDVAFFFSNLERYAQRNWFLQTDTNDGVTVEELLKMARFTLLPSVKFGSVSISERKPTVSRAKTAVTATATGSGVSLAYESPAERDPFGIRSGVLEVKLKSAAPSARGLARIKSLPIASFIEVPFAVRRVAAKDERSSAHMTQIEVWRLWELHCSLSQAAAECMPAIFGSGVFEPMQLRRLFLSSIAPAIDCAVHICPAAFSLKTDAATDHLSRMSASFALLREIDGYLAKASAPPTVALLNKCEAFRKCVDVSFLLTFPSFDGELIADTCIAHMKTSIKSLNQTHSRPFHVYESDLTCEKDATTVVHHIDTLMQLTRR